MATSVARTSWSSPGTTDGPPADSDDVRGEPGQRGPRHVDDAGHRDPARGPPSATATTSVNSPEDEMPTMASPGAEARRVAQELGGGQRARRPGRPGTAWRRYRAAEARLEWKLVPLPMTWTRRIPAARQAVGDGARPARGRSRPSPGSRPGPRGSPRGTMPSIIATASAAGARPARPVAVTGGDHHPDRRPPGRAASVAGDAAVVGHQHVDLVEPEDVAGRDLLELGRVGEDDDRAGHPPQRPVGEDLGHRVVHQALLDADGADAHEQRVRAQLAGGELGEVAEHRVHPAAARRRRGR